MRHNLLRLRGAAQAEGVLWVAGTRLDAPHGVAPVVLPVVVPLLVAAAVPAVVVAALVSRALTCRLIHF